MERIGFVKSVEKSMITPNKITKKQAIHILKLLKRRTRAEIMARLAPATSYEYTNYYGTMCRIDDRLRKYAFGSSNLANLGLKWGLLKQNKKKKRKKTSDL